MPAGTEALGCSINDVLLSMAAGALRDYLIEKGDAVDGLEIRAIVPVNLRPQGDGKNLGNHFGLVFLDLPVGIEHPLERLYEVRQRMKALKGSYQPIIALGLLVDDPVVAEAGQREPTELVLSTVGGGELGDARAELVTVARVVAVLIVDEVAWVGRRAELIPASGPRVEGPRPPADPVDLVRPPVPDHAADVVVDAEGLGDVVRVRVDAVHHASQPAVVLPGQLPADVKPALDKH